MSKKKSNISEDRQTEGEVQGFHLGDVLVM